MISTMNNALNNTLLLSHQKILKGNGYFKYIVKYCSHTSIISNKFLIIYAIKWLKNSTEISSSIKPRYHAVATRLNVILPATASQLMEKYLDGNFYLFFFPILFRLLHSKVQHQNICRGRFNDCQNFNNDLYQW